jgi:hypothetical protein
MKHRWPVAIIVWVAIGMTGVVAAQHTYDEEHPHFHSLRLRNGSPAPATIDRMAWLAGRWTGHGQEGETEEIWSPPKAGVMTGMLRQWSKDRVFYEFLMLAEDRGTVVLKIRHFNSDFSGWEDKAKSVDLPLVKVEPSAVHFDGVSFIRRGAGALTVYLQLYDRTTELTREEELTLRRQ